MIGPGPLGNVTAATAKELYLCPTVMYIYGYDVVIIESGIRIHWKCTIFGKFCKKKINRMQIETGVFMFYLIFSSS